MSKTLAAYLSNVLWAYLYLDFEEIKTVDPKFIDKVLGTIEKTETELIKLGVTEAAISRILKMCEEIVYIWRTDTFRLPEPYRTKIEKLIFSTPHQ